PMKELQIIIDNAIISFPVNFILLFTLIVLSIMPSCQYCWVNINTIKRKKRALAKKAVFRLKSIKSTDAGLESSRSGIKGRCEYAYDFIKIILKPGTINISVRFAI